MKKYFVYHKRYSSRRSFCFLKEFTFSKADVFNLMTRKAHLSALPPSSSAPEPANRPAAQPVEHTSSKRTALLERQVSDLEMKLSIALQRIDELERHTSLTRKHFDISESEMGILNYLHLCERSAFDRRFICSQSSAGLYGILNPDSQNYYGSPDKGDAWVQFEFRAEMTFFGFLIQSYLSCYIKSYRIVSINSDFSETVVFSTASETGLQGELKVVTHDFQPPIKTRVIRFE
jgi:hypothetical protein